MISWAAVVMADKPQMHSEGAIKKQTLEVGHMNAAKNKAMVHFAVVHFAVVQFGVVQFGVERCVVQFGVARCVAQFGVANPRWWGSISS